MAGEHEPNRSSAFTPEQLAAVNTMLSSGIKEAISGIFAQLGPILKDVALTPEKLQEMERIRRAPSDEQTAAIARETRERQQSREEDAENRARMKAMQDGCLHRDKKGMEALCTVHNYPDHQVRGICPICHSLIEPRHWEIDAPEKGSGKARPVLKPAHKDYMRVLQVESMS